MKAFWTNITAYKLVCRGSIINGGVNMINIFELLQFINEIFLHFANLGMASTNMCAC